MVLNMSDSDTDLLSSQNVLTFQSLGTTINARGPNINNANISSLSFRNNIMTSTMNMPWNIDRSRYAASVCDQSFRNNVMTSSMNMPWIMDRPRYAASVCDQRSTYQRRERDTSPMSLHSASGMQLLNLHRSDYPGTISSHRSMYNGRSGSPVSIRTIDSNTSISAKDIALAFKNGTFNKFDFKIIREAFMKSRIRKKKRRNSTMFQKGYHRRSESDSEDRSSISSDDCVSTRTSRSTIYKANMSSCRSTKTDISHFRRTMKESNIIMDCTENMRQNSFKNMLSHGFSREKESFQTSQEKWQNVSMAVRGVNSQKDRLKSSFLLPSQRFNQPVSSLTVSEKPNRLQRINEANTLNVQNCVSNQIERPGRQSLADTESEQEEIFPDVTIMERTCTSNSGKRIRDKDDINEQDKKRAKVSPQKNKSKPKTPKQNNQSNISIKSNDFVFAKPQLPIKKQTISKQQKLLSVHKTKEIPPPQGKQQTVENITSEYLEQPVEKVISSSQKAVKKLISKSSQSLGPRTEKTSLQIPQSPEKEIVLPTDTTQHSTTDLSMRPSFIKRKLFTQKVDVAEKNSNFDSLQADSPQTINVYRKIQKEKNRARRLVTTQSCLNRDVQDDSNLLELIHKIVPADRMNVTTATNRTEIQNKSKPTNSEKWDVTSIITTCNNSDDGSDTYTDEDIFTKDNKKQQKCPEEKPKYKPTIEAKKKTINELKIKPANEAKENSAGSEKTIINNGKQKGIYSTTDDKQQTLQIPKPTECKVVIQALLPKNFKEPIIKKPNSPTEKNDLVKTNIYKGVKSFWDTDAESDLETTPLKRNTVTSNPEIMAKVPPHKHPLSKISRQSNVSTLSRNKIDDTSKIKITTIQTMNSSLINKQKKESKPSKQSKKPTSSKRAVDKIVTETASLKENKPPGIESNKNSSNKPKLSNTSVKPDQQNGKSSPEKKDGSKRRVGRQQRIVREMALEKSKPQINNCDLSLNNKESQQLKVHNNTLRLRAQRKPNVHKCCGEPDTSNLSNSTNNNTTLYRSLRSREVDLSASFTPKPKRVLKAKTDDVCKSSGDDVSFTLNVDFRGSRPRRQLRASVALRPMRLRNTITS